MTYKEENVGLEQRIGERITRLTQHLYRIQLPTGYRVGDVNVFFLDGDEPVLFDSGTGGDEGMAVLADSLKTVGRRISDIRHLMLTHAHIDHCGGAGKICDEAGCGVFVHSREVDRVRDFMEVSKKELYPMLPMLVQMGFERSAGEVGLLMLNKLGETTSPCPCAGELPEKLETSHGAITFVWVPGHSSGDVLFRIEGLPHVITGDHVLPGMTTSPAVDIDDGLEYDRSFRRYQDSLKQTAALEGLPGCAGHGPVFPDVGGRARSLLRTQEKRKLRMAAVLAERGPGTPLEIAVRLFGTEYRFEMLMFANEVTGYARQLESEGLCSIRREPGFPDMIVPTRPVTGSPQAG